MQRIVQAVEKELVHRCDASPSKAKRRAPSLDTLAHRVIAIRFCI
jgi:hypothetical protein